MMETLLRGLTENSTINLYLKCMAEFDSFHDCWYRKEIDTALCTVRNIRIVCCVYNDAL